MSKKMILKYICYASVLCAFSANMASADTVETTVSTTSPSISTTSMEEVDAKGSSDNAAVVDTVSAEETLVPETSSEMTEVGNTAETVVTPVETTTEAVTDSKEALQEGVKEYRTDFDAYDETTMAKADWWNGNPFGAVWKPDQVAVENGVMTLTIDKGADASAPVEYISGELRTQDFFHYGTYQVSMKPIKNSGTVSSFFTYTGPSDNNPWDEVDIEFLGKDTTKVQFNYYTNGKGEHEYIHELGFDASEAFHTYAFDWQKDYITWYVDGKAVYTATENLPVTPGRIMMNAWSGMGVDEWLEAFDGKTPLVAYYDWFSYSNKVADVTPLSESNSADNGVKPKKADDSASDTTGQDVNTTIELKTVTNDKTVKVEASSKELGKVTRVANKDLVPLASVVSGKKLPNTGENSSLLATLLGGITALFTLLAWCSFKEND